MIINKACLWLLNFPGRLNREEGQGLVEYALILLLIAMAVVGALKLFGEELLNTYNVITSAIPSP